MSRASGACERHTVHRDPKPENEFVLHDERPEAFASASGNAGAALAEGLPAQGSGAIGIYDVTFADDPRTCASITRQLLSYPFIAEEGS